MTTTEVERDNDSLCTPQWILDRVRQMGVIGFDPCSNPWSAVGARQSASKHAGQDGLALDWEEWCWSDQIIFCNPPYSDPKPWCLKAKRTLNREIIMLVKHDPSTSWFSILRDFRDAQCDLHKRVSFDGGLHKSGMFASSLVYTGPRPFLFCHVFQDVGDVRVFR